MGIFEQVSRHSKQTTEYEYHFAPDFAVRQARRSLEDLEGSVTPDTIERLRLLVSELATNAVRHAGLVPESGSELGSPDSNGDIGLRLVVSTGKVRVEVTDPGPGFEAPSNPTPDSERGSGFGLYLVNKLADRWGVEIGETNRGKPNRVWLELDYGS